MRFILSVLILAFCSLAYSQEVKQWSLQDCIDYALENNISLKQGELQNEILQNNLTQTKWNRLPNLNASASHNYNIGRTIDPFTNTFIDRNIQSNAFSLTSGVTLYSGGRINNSIKQTQTAYDASSEGQEALKNQISLSVATAYLQIIQAEENLKLADAQVEITEAQLERARKLVSSGLDNKAIVYGLEAQLANDRVQSINAQNQIQLAYNNMLNLLQIDNNTPFEIKLIDIDTLPEYTEESIASIYDLAIQNMPEVKQAELSVLESQLSQKVVGASRYPTLSAYGNLNTVYSETGIELAEVSTQLTTIGYTKTTNEEVLSLIPVQKYVQSSFGNQLNNNLGRSVGLSLSVPVFNNFRTSTSYENAKLNTEINELNLVQTKNQLRSDITTAYTNMKAAKSRYDAAVLNESAQFNNYDFNQKRFDAGILNSTDLLNAKNMWTQAQNQLINAKYEYVFRIMILEFYKGNDIRL